MTARGAVEAATRVAPLLLAAGCAPSAPDTGDPWDACDEAGERLDARVCVHRVPDEATWVDLSVAGGAVDVARAGKYLAPARGDARLPTLFMDVHAYALHYDLLVAAWPELFPALTGPEYNELILDPVDRELYAGTLLEYLDDGLRWGFTVWDDPADAAATVTLADVQATWEALEPRFSPGALAFAPSSANQLAAARAWNAPFPIRGLGEDLPYEVYTAAHGYGTLRLWSLPELALASEEGRVGWQDVVALDEAPRDLETVVGGVVTGTRQAELSHLAVRTSARGTPNCYVRRAHEELVAWDGLLVRLECGSDDWSMREATPEEALAFWETVRPEPVEVPEPDLDWWALPALEALPTDTPADRSQAVSRFGAKAANLAALYQRLDVELGQPGLAVPFAWYAAWLEEATWTVDLGGGPGEHSYAETLDAWLDDEEFAVDAALRRSRLAALREAMEGSAVDPELLTALDAQVAATLGSDAVMVRLRSSSNAEDALGFGGAGLYRSTSACLADDLDGDESGPSRCDPSEAEERTAAAGLVQVWASLWSMAAFEERAWYDIDHRRCAMGLLVHARADAERANAVVFTGNPTEAGDGRYLVNAQWGETDVVSSDPGVLPEKVLLTVEEGEVVSIERLAASTEVPPGFFVLDDAELEELGSLAWQVGEVFPVDGEAPEGAEVLLDTEWKLRRDRTWLIKQVRPFLR